MTLYKGLKKSWPIKKKWGMSVTLMML